MDQFDRFIYDVGYIVVTIGGTVLFFIVFIKIFPKKGDKIMAIIAGIVSIIGIIGFIYKLIEIAIK